MEAARAAGDNEDLRHLLSLAATLANLRGESEKANEYLDEAARLAPGVKDAEAQEEIPRGGRLVVAMASPVKALEPIDIEILEEEEILANVFETLVATDQEGNLVPALCERWEARNEGRSFLLMLRDNVRFQDGHFLTAQDVKDSFERAVRHASHDLPAALAAIRGVADFAERRENELTGLVINSSSQLEVHLNDSLSIYPALLTDHKVGILRERPRIRDRFRTSGHRPVPAHRTQHRPVSAGAR
jgi:ABC-type transport system substrate-binding protein